MFVIDLNIWEKHPEKSFQLKKTQTLLLYEFRARVKYFLRDTNTNAKFGLFKYKYKYLIQFYSNRNSNTPIGDLNFKY